MVLDIRKRSFPFNVNFQSAELSKGAQILFQVQSKIGLNINILSLGLGGSPDSSRGEDQEVLLNIRFWGFLHRETAPLNHFNRQKLALVAKINPMLFPAIFKNLIQNKFQEWYRIAACIIIIIYLSFAVTDQTKEPIFKQWEYVGYEQNQQDVFGTGREIK